MTIIQHRTSALTVRIGESSSFPGEDFTGVRNRDLHRGTDKMLWKRTQLRSGALEQTLELLGGLREQLGGLLEQTIPHRIVLYAHYLGKALVAEGGREGHHVEWRKTVFKVGSRTGTVRIGRVALYTEQRGKAEATEHTTDTLIHVESTAHDDALMAQQDQKSLAGTRLLLASRLRHALTVGQHLRIHFDLHTEQLFQVLENLMREEVQVEIGLAHFTGLEEIQFECQTHKLTHRLPSL
mmetsp:Transcript_31350/g.78679  ORF Transcript_31350/g.78679 Transcript_31350/m.78679 type:complete len:239 (-) Transcript_31350:1648-2364(-)